MSSSLRCKKSQSAMEYLMTYGWAILIIAVVLGALFQLGVFNSSSFSPRAPPGACQVFRPSGPGTTTNINLMGVCTGQLPQYVAGFDGQHSWVNLQNPAGLRVSYITATAWVYLNSYNNYNNAECQEAVSQWGGGSNGWILRAVNGGGDGCGGPIPPSTPVSSQVFAWGGGTTGYSCVVGIIPLKTWTFMTLTYDGSTLQGWLNGQSKCSTPVASSLMINGQSAIGSAATAGDPFNGTIANVQIYNVSLSANQIQALYLEGIGGAPMKLQNLVGWWPLNGNSNDYSGNNNNGVPTSLTFTSQYGK